MQRKATTLILVGLMALLLVIGVSAQEDDMMEGTEFTVTIENIAGIGLFENSGIFNTPDMAEEPGPALPGSAYTFTVTAVPGDYLNFATMLVQSNDLFFAPDENGIPLFDDMDTPVNGDVTRYILLWDAGTEVNEEPGVGENQAPRQPGPDTGDDEMGVVLPISEVMDGFEYPPVAALIRVTISSGDMMGDDEME